jgi:hypothetical protein
VMDEDPAPMAEYAALIEQLCAQRSALVQTMVASPEQITGDQIRDLAALQCAFLAVEAEKPVAGDSIGSERRSLPNLSGPVAEKYTVINHHETPLYCELKHSAQALRGSSLPVSRA